MIADHLLKCALRRAGGSGSGGGDALWISSRGLYSSDGLTFSFATNGSNLRAADAPSGIVRQTSEAVALGYSYPEYRLMRTTDGQAWSEAVATGVSGTAESALWQLEEGPGIVQIDGAHYLAYADGTWAAKADPQAANSGDVFTNWEGITYTETGPPTTESVRLVAVGGGIAVINASIKRNYEGEDGSTASFDDGASFVFYGQTEIEISNSDPTPSGLIAQNDGGIWASADPELYSSDGASWSYGTAYFSGVDAIVGGPGGLFGVFVGGNANAWFSSADNGATWTAQGGISLPNYGQVPGDDGTHIYVGGHRFPRDQIAYPDGHVETLEDELGNTLTRDFGHVVRFA